MNTAQAEVLKSMTDVQVNQIPVSKFVQKAETIHDEISINEQSSI